MLVTFALTLEAFVSDPEKGRLRSPAFDRMRQVWFSHGILVLPRDIARKTMLKDTLRSLPQNARKRWQTALKHFPTVELDAEGAYDQFIGATMPHRPHGRDFEVLALSEDQFSELYTAAEAYSCVVDGTEVVEICAFDQASRIIRARELSSSEICRDAKSDDVWIQRVAPVAMHVTNVAIIDRHAISRFDERGEHSGIFRVLSWLSMMHNVKSIDLFSSDCRAKERNSDRGNGDLLNSLQELASRLRHPSGDCTFRGYVIDDKLFARISHDRTMRLGRYCIDIGVGLEVFNAGNVWRDTTFSFRTIELAEPTRRELELKHRARVRYERTLTT